jgi:hypothetical protein
MLGGGPHMVAENQEYRETAQCIELTKSAAIGAQE